MVVGRAEPTKGGVVISNGELVRDGLLASVEDVGNISAANQGHDTHVHKGR